MNAKPNPIELTPLLPARPAPASAEQIVEGLRLWEPPSVSGPDARGAKGARTGQDPWGGRPRVFLNMACTVDGRVAVDGRSGSIGNRADREMFHALRTAVDAVLVGAGTVRVEGYGRLVREEAPRRLRRARGLAEEPLVCVVSAGLDLSPELPLLADPAARVAILTPAATGELPGRPAPDGSAAAVEYVRAARDGVLDLPAALAELHTRLGVRTLLCEGGPHLNGHLFAAGLVDELFLSLAPKLAGGPGSPAPSPGQHAGSADPRASLRIIAGPELDPPVELELLGALESESLLLLRYRVGGAGGER